MRVVGIKVLKNKLSEYVRIAASGETVLVTDRDRVVAELVPPRTDRGETVAEAQYAEAVRLGIIRPPLVPRSAAPPRGSTMMSLDEILEDQDRDRVDG